MEMGRDFKLNEVEPLVIELLGAIKRRWTLVCFLFFLVFFFFFFCLSEEVAKVSFPATLRKFENSEAIAV